MSDSPPPDGDSVEQADSSPQAIDSDGVATSTSPTTHSTSYNSRPPPVSSYYSSDDPHHSLMEASYVKATSSPLLSPQPSRTLRKCILGIAAMDKKTRSKPMTQILDRLRAYGEFIIVMMGDSLLLDEERDVYDWPVVDCLISFSSKGFPLNKVIEYVRLRKPFCVNDVPSQTALLDRRQVYHILEKHKIPTPRHLYIHRTSRPQQQQHEHDGDRDSIAREAQKDSANHDEHIAAEQSETLEEYPTHILINGQRMNKPLVEKPFDADDHNVIIYYNASQGGGSRRLFRKVGNRSSRFYPKVNSLRRDGSYIYEELFINGKDLKVYTIGPGYAHGEMRKSPVVDGIVERDPDKKELRLLTRLTEEEKQIAAQICVAFKQNICGFDIIRFQGRSYVIDVNGWSFVKGNQRYYDKCARILRKMCLGCRQGRAALALGEDVRVPRHLDLSVVSEDREGEDAAEKHKKWTAGDESKEGESGGRSGGGIVEVVTKGLMDIFAPLDHSHAQPATQPAADKTAPSSASSSPVRAPVDSSPVSIPAFSSALKTLSPRSLLACISSPDYSDPLTPFSLDPSRQPSDFLSSPTSLTPVASTNIATAQHVIQDTDNNDILRALVAVFRHADRTPKQKVKLKTKHPSLLALFKQQMKKGTAAVPSSTGASSPAHASASSVRYTEVKLKKKEELMALLQTVKVMIVKEKLRNKKKARMEKEKSNKSTLTSARSTPSLISPPVTPSAAAVAAQAAAALDEEKEREKAVKGVGEEKKAGEADGATAGGTSGGGASEEDSGDESDFGDSQASDVDDFEKAFEREMLDKERKEREKDPEYLSKLLQVQTVLDRGYAGMKVQVKPKKVEGGRVTQVLLVCKWGGEMTHAGMGQARQYAAAFWDDCCPPPPIPASFFIQTAQQKEEEKKVLELTVHTTHTPSLARVSSTPSSANHKAMDDEHGDQSVMLDHNNTLDQASRETLSKMVSDAVQVKQQKPHPTHHNNSLSVPIVYTTSHPAPTADHSASATPTAASSTSTGHSFTDSLKNGLNRLLRVPSSLMHHQRTTSPPHLVNTNVSDTAAASAVVNPLLQQEVEKYRQKQAKFEQQRLDFIGGMQVYSSDEPRVVASAKAFYMSTMEHAHGIGEQSEREGGAAAAARKLKESTALIASFKAAAEKNIHHDATVLRYLDDTSSAAESMARAKEGVKFLLMAENAFTPAQVTRHMLAVEQIARATSEAERTRIEREEEDQLKKAKEEAEAREKQEKGWAERKKKEQKQQEREEKLLDELAMQEEDPLQEAVDDGPGNGEEGERKERDYKKRPAALSSTAMMSSSPSPCSSPQPTSSAQPVPLPPSPPPYSPPPSPSSFEPNAMTAWGIRCLRWVGKPRDTLHHLYGLLKALQAQIHSKCEFADKHSSKQPQDAADGPASTKTTVDEAQTDSTTLAVAASSRPRRLSLGGGSSGEKRAGGDVFEYVFDEGDEEIVGSQHKFKKQPARRFAADHLLCHQETLFLLKMRWDRLIQAFYDPSSRSFDPTKIPDVYDCIKYDVLHNSEFISDVRPLYSAIKRVADCVVPQEYGVLRKDRWSIGVNIARPLFRQIIANLEIGLQAEPSHRVTLYFSSESHIHALRNVLLLCGIAANRTVATTLDAIELNYLSHAVFRLYEDLSQQPTHPLRFYVSVQFSPGAALDPFIFTEAGHTLPVSRPVPVHGRIPFSIFKQLFASLTTELPAVKPYCGE